MKNVSTVFLAAMALGFSACTPKVEEKPAAETVAPVAEAVAVSTGTVAVPADETKAGEAPAADLTVEEAKN